MKVEQICEFMRQFAPLQLAEDWDNVGLLIGDPAAEVSRLMTCLTITPASCAEAISQQADLIITHHPLPFRGLKKLTTETTAGRMILDLISAGVAVYSPHTAFDSATDGINQQIAIGLNLQHIAPLVAAVDPKNLLGSGRIGSLPNTVDANSFAMSVRDFFQLDQLRFAGSLAGTINKVAIACGSAGQFIDHAIRADCQAFITGETNFHTCLEAEAKNILLILPGHYASERFALETLAANINKEFESLNVWASARETNPIKLV